MIDAARFAQVLRGLRLILVLEPGGLSFFEKSYAGFVRSFTPALIIAPLQAVHIAALYLAASPRPGLTSTIIVESLAYMLSWTLFPFVMMYITRSMGKADKFFAYIVPYNWLQLLVGLIALPLTLLVDVRFLGNDGAVFFNFMLLGFFVVYGAFLAHAALEVAPWTAFGIVAMDILLSLVSSEIIDNIPT
jgi:hypothetical protein